MQTRLEDICREVVEPLGYDLVAVEYRRGRTAIVRVFIDKQGGVGMEDCVTVTHILSDALDVADPIAGAYTMEVSSPGLDRPLVTEREFWRKIGERVSLTYRPQVNDDSTVTTSGTIAAAEGGVLRLAVGEDELTIPLDAVVQATIEL